MAKKKQILDETSSDTNKTQKRQYVRTKETCPSIDAFIHDVQRVAAELGKKTVTCTEYEDKGKYSRSYIVRYIPSWAEVLQKAELEKSGYKTDGYTDEELLEKLSTLQDKLNHKPTCKNVRESKDVPSLNVYYRHFDKWNNVLSRLEEYKLKQYKDKHKEESAGQMPMQIIGLQILPETDERIRKSLKPGWYPFVKCKNNIGVTEDWPIVDDTALPKNFFHIDDVSVNGSDVPEINVMAIVGKNGTGKSTLLNIIYMIINNLAYEILKSKQSKVLKFVKHLNAKLYYRDGGSYYCVESTENQTTVFKDQTDTQIAELRANERISFLAQSFFYTISMNYSLYAHNSEEEVPINNLSVDGFTRTHIWINNLFDKNDGYQIPIVFTPYRDCGQINIHNESRLATRRVINLSLLFHLQGGKDQEFLENYEPIAIEYAYDKSYKIVLEQKIKQYLKKRYVIKKNLESILQKFQNAWKKHLKQKGVADSVIPELREMAIFYLAYKTLKIYIYQKIRAPFNDYSLIREQVPSVEDQILKYVETIVNRDEDHITRKIQQCLKYLLTGKYAKEGSIRIDDLFEKGAYTYDEIDAVLPPPFYVLDLNYKRIVKKGEIDDAKPISLRSMSSGEKQLLFSTSYVLYHMTNLAGIFEDNNLHGHDRIKYRRLFLIFDETELYYHPDFQREFVYKLLRCIQLGRLNQKALNIKAVNILLVTHSPYMLSDIPACNILRLGEHKKKNTETFGANIYDLLDDQFFMDSFVGEFAQHKISEIISRINNCENEDIFELRKVINLIGDEWIRELLSDQLSDRLGKRANIEKEIAALQRRLEVEQRKLNNFK